MLAKEGSPRGNSEVLQLTDLGTWHPRRDRGMVQQSWLAMGRYVSLVLWDGLLVALRHRWPRIFLIQVSRDIRRIRVSRVQAGPEGTFTAFNGIWLG